MCAMWLASCTPKRDPTVTIAMNPSPGYEYLRLAEQLGYFEQLGLSIEIVPFNSLSDCQRAYISGRVDGFAGTMVEAVHAQVLSTRPVTVVLLPDYSNGGDVVVARLPITRVEQLKGARVGAEVSSLGIYMLDRTLESADLSLDDIELLNFEQSGAELAFKEGRIDAFVTYPPYSLKLLELEGVNTIFSSQDIPYDIIDILAVGSDIIHQQPEFVPRLHQAWQLALEFAQQNPEQAYKLAANQQGITPEQFKQSLQHIVILDRDQQQKLVQENDSLHDKAVDVCHALKAVDSIMFECSDLPNIFYSGDL